MLVNELKLVKLWYGFDSGFMNVIINGERKILVYKGY